MRDRVRKYGPFGGMILALFVSALALSVSHVDAQSTANRVLLRGNLMSFTAQTAVGSTSAFVVNGTATHTTQLIVTGAPATCTGRLQGSNDHGTTWFNITAADITCTSSIVSSTTGVSTYAVRFTILTLTGGTSPTITAHYSGI